MRRFHKFLLILFFGFLYLGFRLSPGIGWPVWVGLIVTFVGVLLYPSNWLRKSSLDRAQHVWRWKVYLDMGLLCFLVSLTLLRDLIFLPLLLMNSENAAILFGPSSNLAVIGLSLFALTLGMWTALSGPKVKSVKVPIKGLPVGLEGFRIAQISDLHVGPTIGEKYVRKVVKKVNSLLPHMTVLTGDIVDGEADHHLPAVSHLSKLEPAGQILYVTGNHEYYWDGPRWIKEFENLGLHVLLNSNRIIQHENCEILVAGVLDPASILAHPDHKPDLQAAMGEESDSRFKILLAHQPTIANEAAEAGFDLLLSGHTHAGQFFPFTLLIFSVHKFVRGLKACGKMWVYVNQGTGYWGPPIRLGTVTEITLLELTGKNVS